MFPATLLRYYAGVIRNATFEETRAGLIGGPIVVRHTPIGVVAAVAPWNFPRSLAGAFRYAPALAAGCRVVMKPSPETVLDSWEIADAAEEAGLPGVINIVPEAGLRAMSAGHPRAGVRTSTNSGCPGKIAES